MTAATWQPFNRGPALYGTYCGDGTHLFGFAGRSVSAYDPTTGVWAARASLPAGNGYGNAAAAAGKVFYVGGYSDTYNPLNTVYAYDPANDAAGWVAVHSLPFTITNPQLAVFGGKLYCLTGGLDALYVYDPANDAAGWVAASPALPSPSYYGYLAAGGGKLFYAARSDVGVWSYSATTGWVAIASLPPAHDRMAMAVGQDGRLWATAVVVADADYPRQHTATHSYDPANNAAGWRKEDLLPFYGDPATWLIPLGSFIYYHDGYNAYRMFAGIPDGTLYPAATVGTTKLLFTAHLMPYAADLYPDQIYPLSYWNSVAVRLHQPVVPFTLDPAIGSTAVTARTNYLSTSVDLVDWFGWVDDVPLAYIRTTLDLVDWGGWVNVSMSVTPAAGITPDLVAGSTSVAAAIAVDRTFTPGLVAGTTTVAAAIAVTGSAGPVKNFTLAVVAGSTTVGIVPVNYVELAFEPVYSETSVDLAMALACVFELDVAAGWTQVHIADNTFLLPAVVAGSTAVTAAIRSAGQRRYLLDKVVGSTVVRIAELPNLGNNTPILLAFSATARLESTDLLVSE